MSRIHQHFGLHMLRPALLLAGFAAVYLVVNPRSAARGSLFRHWPARVVAALGILACVSAPFGISLGGSAKFFLDEYSKVLLFTLLLMIAIRDARDLWLFIWGYVLSAAILVWMSIFVFDLSSDIGSYAMRLAELYMFDANDLGLVLTVAIPLTVLAFENSRWLGKTVSGAVLLGIGVAIARSGSRGAFVGVAVVGIALLVALRQISAVKRLGFVIAIAAGLVLAAPAGYWKQMQTIASLEEDYNWSARGGRRQIAERGLQYMLRYPVFGLGLNNFGRAEGTISAHARRPDREGVRWLAPHNSFVQVMAELGVGGLVLFSILVGRGITGLVGVRRRLPATWARGDPEQRLLYSATLYLPIAMLGFAATCIFVSFAYNDPVYILAALILGVHRSLEVRAAAALPGEPAPAALPDRPRFRPSTTPHAGMTRPPSGTTGAPAAP